MNQMIENLITHLRLWNNKAPNGSGNLRFFSALSKSNTNPEEMDAEKNRRDENPTRAFRDRIDRC